MGRALSVPLFLACPEPLLDDVAEEDPQRNGTEAHDKDYGIQDQYPLFLLCDSIWCWIPVGSGLPLFKLLPLRREAAKYSLTLPVPGRALFRKNPSRHTLS